MQEDIRDISDTVGKDIKDVSDSVKNKMK